MQTELKVMSARAVNAAVSAIALEFSRESGCTVQFDFAPVGTLESRIANGETADVIILSEAAIAKLDKAGALVAGSARALGRMCIGVAVRDGATMPDLSTPEAFRALLVSSRAIAVSDPAIGGTSAVYLPKLFERIGLTAELEPKLRRQKGGGGDVAECVARGDADIGITFISEILRIAGVRVAGPLPDAYGNDTTYCAAIPLKGHVPEQARALIDALVQPRSRAAWTSSGFAPA
jgi:molybdate transport system substrate-binding protein